MKKPLGLPTLRPDRLIIRTLRKLVAYLVELAEIRG